MTLIGLHVTQYMYVLFGKVHIYIQKSEFRRDATVSLGKKPEKMQSAKFKLITIKITIKIKLSLNHT